MVKNMRIGAIGIDSSHLPEFTRRIKALNDEGASTCRVTHLFDPGGHDLPKASEWLATAKDLGVAQVGSMDELLANVDGGVGLAGEWDKAPGAALPRPLQ